MTIKTLKEENSIRLKAIPTPDGHSTTYTVERIDIPSQPKIFYTLSEAERYFSTIKSQVGEFSK
ncbi:hypothetical protein LG202_06590 [Methylobacillus methanolivorans]